MKKFDVFINKVKFEDDNVLFYAGIQDSKLKLILNEKMNQSALDFSNLLNNGDATDQEYREALKKGLEQFSEIKYSLDTVDKERICEYYLELMDIVGLQSSNGLLNSFMYGFDPTKSNQ